MCELKVICHLNPLKQRLSRNAVPVYFVFDPLIKCDLFVKFLAVSERKHGKSSVLQMVVKTVISR